MADYYPLLSRALSNLGDSAGPDVRRAIYERARSTLVSQLLEAEPPILHDEIESERAALEAVIARLEIEAEERAKAASQPSRRFKQERAAEARADEAREAEPEMEGLIHASSVSDSLDADPSLADVAEPGSRPPKRRLNWPMAALAVAAIAIVGSLAGLAYVLRDHIDPRQRERAEQAERPATPPPAADTKFDARLGTSLEAPATTPAPSAPAQPIPVAQRATLFLEVPGTTGQVPRTVAGRVVWNFENLPGRPGQPLDPALVGTVEVPDAGLTLRLQMSRNHDNLLPASYLVGLVFTSKDLSVKEVAPVLLKTNESERGAPLVGIEQPLGDNLFVMALSADDADVAKNFDLLTKRGWIEVQFRLADQRRGALVFEKGIAGDRALLTAIDAWK